MYCKYKSFYFKFPFNYRRQKESILFIFTHLLLFAVQIQECSSATQDLFNDHLKHDAYKLGPRNFNFFRLVFWNLISSTLVSLYKTFPLLGFYILFHVQNNLGATVVQASVNTFLQFQRAIFWKSSKSNPNATIHWAAKEATYMK